MEEKKVQFKKTYRRIASAPIFRYLSTIAILVLLYFLYTFVNEQGVFQIKHAEILNTTPTEFDYVDSKILKTYIEEQDYNYFETDINIVRKEVIKLSPFIQSVLVTKLFPNKYALEVTEYEPFLVIQVGRNECNLITQDAYVIIQEKDKNCEVFKQNYAYKFLKITENKTTFEAGKVSSFVITEDIKNILTVLEKYGFTVSNIDLSDSVLKMYYDKKNFITLSLAQDVNTQLARMISVVDEIESSGISVSSIDLRYKRPVLRQK